MYDYVIVGAGLFGASFAALAKRKGRSVLVLEKLGAIGGAIRSERKDNIDVHLYGPHIFHTSDKEAYDFFTSFGALNNFVNCPLANYKGRLFHLPFNMDTFYAIYGTKTPAEAKRRIEEERAKCAVENPRNLEEQALSLVGKEIFEMLIKGYTEKQWGRACKDLPASIIKRLPLRFTYDNNYFNDVYQGVPYDGYTAIVEKMLEGCDVLLDTDFLSDRERYRAMGKVLIYTGEIDRYFGYALGKLSYRTLRFETERLPVEDFQGNAVVNYTEREVPYTRIAEHKHFNPRPSPVTYITKEYPKEFEPGDMPLYPVQDALNLSLYSLYKEKAAKEENVFFLGRLGQYKYFDMDDTILSAMDAFGKIERQSFLDTFGK